MGRSGWRSRDLQSGRRIASDDTRTVVAKSDERGDSDVRSAAATHRARHGLSRCYSRASAWPSSGTRCWPSTATGEDRRAGVRPGAVPRAGPARAAAQGAGLRRLRFTTDVAEVAEFGDVHFVCTGTPQLPGSNGADLSQVEARGDRAGAVPDPVMPGGRQVDRPGRHRAAAGRGSWSRWHPWGRPPSSPGTRSSCARGTRSRTRCARHGWCSGCRRLQAEAMLRAAFRPVLRGGRPRGGHRPGDVGAGQGGGQLVPGDQDLLHQRDGRGVRGDRRGRVGPGRRRWRTTTGSVGVSSSPDWVSAAAACPRTSGRSRTGPRSSACGDAVGFLHDVDAINRRRRERTVALVREQAGGELAGVRVCVLGAAFKPCSDDVRDAPALDVARMLHDEGARRGASSTRRRWTTHGVRHPQLRYADSVLGAADGCGRRGAADRVGPVQGARPALARAAASRPARSWTPGTRWTARPGGGGWSYRALGRRDRSLTFATGVAPTSRPDGSVRQVWICVSGGCKDGVVRQ